MYKCDLAFSLIPISLSHSINILYIWLSSNFLFFSSSCSLDFHSKIHVVVKTLLHRSYYAKNSSASTNENANDISFVEWSAHFKHIKEFDGEIVARAFPAVIPTLIDAPRLRV